MGHHKPKQTIDELQKYYDTINTINYNSYVSKSSSLRSSKLGVKNPTVPVSESPQGQIFTIDTSNLENENFAFRGKNLKGNTGETYQIGASTGKNIGKQKFKVDVLKLKKIKSNFGRKFAIFKGKTSLRNATELAEKAEERGVISHNHSKDIGLLNSSGHEGGSFADYSTPLHKNTTCYFSNRGNSQIKYNFLVNL